MTEDLKPRDIAAMHFAGALIPMYGATCGVSENAEVIMNLAYKLSDAMFEARKKRYSSSESSESSSLDS